MPELWLKLECPECGRGFMVLDQALEGGEAFCPYDGDSIEVPEEE